MGGLRAFLDELHAIAAAYEQTAEETAFEAREDAIMWATTFNAFAELIAANNPAEMLRQTIDFGGAYLQYLQDDSEGGAS